MVKFSQKNQKIIQSLTTNNKNLQKLIKFISDNQHSHNWIQKVNFNTKVKFNNHQRVLQFSLKDQNHQNTLQKCSNYSQRKIFNKKYNLQNKNKQYQILPQINHISKNRIIEQKSIYNKINTKNLSTADYKLSKTNLIKNHKLNLGNYQKLSLKLDKQQPKSWETDTANEIQTNFYDLYIQKKL